MRFLVRFGFLTVLWTVVSLKPAWVIVPHGRFTPGAAGIAGWQLAPTSACDSCEKAALNVVVFLSATVFVNPPLPFVVRVAIFLVSANRSTFASATGSPPAVTLPLSFAEYE